MRRRKSIAKRTREVNARVQRLPTHQLFEWVDQCVYVYGKALKDTQESGDVEYALVLLDEAQVSATILGDIARELQSRYSIR